MLGHELRNPLAPIATALELMRLQSGNLALVAKSRDIIARQVTLMTRMVDDLLDVSRITRGRIELRRELVDLHTVIERAIEMARPLLDERRHHFEQRLPWGPLRLQGDPMRLAQAIANLLNNAAKYTDPGGRITLEVQASGNEWLIAVKDNGIGLAQDVSERIFDLFVQGEHTPARSRGGLGLGLTLVRTIADLHGGSVAVVSAGIGCGSEFMVRLPSAPGLPTQRPGPGRNMDDAAMAQHILVADDNVDAAESLGYLLRTFGHEVVVVYDGLNAVIEAVRMRPDVIILDIDMPKMNGYDVARHLRTAEGLTDSVLVALTGYAQERDRQRAREAGFDHHFAKPLDVDRLTAVLRTCGGDSIG
jgi:CheY-like chemotaxis protein